MSAPQKDVTTLLHLASGGDAQAQDELFRLVEGELRKRAAALLRRERPGHLLQTTVLIDEAFVKLVGRQTVPWQNRSQFYCYAARAMRHVLVDWARKETAEKHGGGRPALSLDGLPEPIERPALDPAAVTALHRALTRLAVTHGELSQVIELHYFGGLELKRIADEVLHIPYRTLKRRCQVAKALLRQLMEGDDP
jgi:RNA polymerase sigma factor (TIGR02999 family)